MIFSHVLYQLSYLGTAGSLGAVGAPRGVLLVLTKGQDTAQDGTKRDFLAESVAAVNQHRGFGRWACDVSRSPLRTWRMC